MQPNASTRAGANSCSECGSRLSHDQRYCLDCGARRGPLPRHVSQVIAAIHERGRRVVTAVPLAAEPEPTRFDAWLGAPRAAAVAVMAMLGFGVVVGSAVTGSAANSFGSLIVAGSPPNHQAASQSAGAVGSGDGSGGGDGGGGGGGGTITITTTTPAPPTPAGGAAVAAASLGAPTTTGTSGAPTATNLPAIKHVFLIVLSSQEYNQTFGQTGNDPYLGKTLARQGETLVNYYAVADSPLANEIAMISGQGPNPETANDCPTYDVFAASGFGADDQELGNGCVYPPVVPSLADQLTAAKRTWKAYLQTEPGQQKAGPEQCHPPIGSSQGSQPTQSEPYSTWRNPFLFFHSLVPRTCPKTDVALGHLAIDLKHPGTTPTLSYIVPDACDDGSDTPCAPNALAGMSAADSFLKSVVPEIKRSRAYKAGGLIAITFDNAPQSGPNADQSSCCDTPSYPNMQGIAPPTGTGPTGATGTTSPSGQTGTTSPTSASGPTSQSGGATSPTGGGGQVGLLLLSQFVKPNTLEVTDYFNHFSLLASMEKLFGLQPLGYAKAAALPVFGPAVYTNYTG
jgi:phosphatidylinositol-3-phosphatase